MEKFSREKHPEVIQTLPFSYFSSDLYLDFAAYIFKKNGENIIVWQDILFSHEFPSIFMPKVKENWINSSVAFAAEDDVKAVNDENIEIILKKPMGAEFFYETKNFTNPSGDLRTKINKFINNYKFEITNECPKDKIVEFYDFWKSQRKHESITFDESEEFFNFCLDNLDKYGIKQVYVLSDNRLIGLAWGMEHQSGNWIGLHLKADYSYRGLSRFLHQERAKLFTNLKEFTLGTGTNDLGIENYKEELGPAYKKNYFYILMGERKSY